jgi:hypothetical protein
MGRSVPTTPGYSPQQDPNVINNNWQSWPGNQPKPAKPAPLLTGQRTMPGGPLLPPNPSLNIIRQRQFWNKK